MKLLYITYIFLNCWCSNFWWCRTYQIYGEYESKKEPLKNIIIDIIIAIISRVKDCSGLS